MGAKLRAFPSARPSASSQRSRRSSALELETTTYASLVSATGEVPSVAKHSYKCHQRTHTKSSVAVVRKKESFYFGYYA